MEGGATDEKTMQAEGGAIDEDCMRTEGGGPSLSLFAAAASRENPLRQLLDGETYSSLDPIFREMPFIRPLSRRGQLQTMIRYVQLNPQRLATKRLMPGFFHVQRGIAIAGRTYAGKRIDTIIIVILRIVCLISLLYVRNHLRRVLFRPKHLLE